MERCKHCGNVLKPSAKKYCSNKCQADFEYEAYINNWKLGNEHGNRGIRAKNISGHIRRYMIERYGDKCSLCGWNTVHPLMKHVPLEIDHIDGDSENNSEANLQMICPNCHALTISFRNLNRGRGRAWRTQKYLKNNLK